MVRRRRKVSEARGMVGDLAKSAMGEGKRGKGHLDSERSVACDRKDRPCRFVIVAEPIVPDVGWPRWSGDR